MPEPTKIFISYAHKDAKWLEQLRIHLIPLARNAKIDPWDDSKLVTGSKWKEEIKKAIAEADIGVMLVTPNFLASDFIFKNELPPLLANKTVFWIAVSPCLYEETELAQFQSANDPSKSIESLKGAARNSAWVSICKKILAAASNPP